MSSLLAPALLVAPLLAGCSVAGGAGGANGGTAGGGSGGSSGEQIERPTEIPPGLIECESADKDAVQVPASVAGVSYDVPSGFDEVAGYTQVQPAEGDYTDTYLALRGAVGAEVIAIVHYPQLANGPVTDACGELDLDVVLARLAEHNELSGSEVSTTPELDEVAGLPVLIEERTYPGRGFSLRHYWFYGRDDLLNISCQWTSHRDEVVAACAELIASLRFG